MKAEVVLQEVLYVRGDVEWLRARCGGPALSDKKRVVAYLRRGRVYKGMSTVDRDLLGDGGWFGAGIYTHTDGVWAWKSSVAYHVEKHDFALPAAFLAHIRERGFRMPRKAALHRLEIAREVVERDGLA